MITLNPNSHLGTVIARYTGRKVMDLEVVPDPQVAGCFAVQAIVKAIVAKGVAYPVYFLLTDVPLQDASEEDLQEVEFTEWPPVSTKPMSSLEKRAAGLTGPVSGPVGISGLREKVSRPTHSWAERNLPSKK